MKVLLINGSPHEHGCTNAALSIIANEMKIFGRKKLTLFLT